MGDRGTVCFAFFLFALLGALALQLTAPSEMHRIDQPKTASYTIDMVVHGRWFLPKDSTGAWATKPPLVNWITAPLCAMGWHSQMAFWLPIASAQVLGIGLTIWWARRLFAAGAAQEAQWTKLAFPLACLAGVFYFASRYTATLFTYVRPDGILIPLLTLSWVLGTLLVQRLADRGGGASGPVWPLALAFWLSVGLVALTKAIPAIYPPLYVLLFAKVSRGRFRDAGGAGWSWGVPLALAMFALWVIPAYLADPDYFKSGLLGAETLGRFSGVQGIYGAQMRLRFGPGSLVTTMKRVPDWLMTRFLPVSIPAVVGVWMTRFWRRRTHPLMPAVLWLALVCLMSLLTANKTAQYLLPGIPAMAILAAYACFPAPARWRVPTASLIAAAALVAFGLGAYAHLGGYAAQDPTGRRLVSFAEEANKVVGHSPVVYVATGINSLQPLMGRNQAGPPSEDLWRDATWVIAPVRLAGPIAPIAVSEPVCTYMGCRAFEALGVFRAADFPADHPIRSVREINLPAAATEEP
jgi:4-amino-4-deoxy-L-arabinose transferase-like glycosyltransferase